LGLRRALVISAVLGAVVPLISYYLWFMLHIYENVTLPLRRLIDGDSLIYGIMNDFVSLAVLCVPIYMLVGAALWTILRPKQHPTQY
jgi:hypothetical protein